MSLRTNGFKIDAKVFETDSFYPSPVEVELLKFMDGNNPDREYVIPAEDLGLFIKLMFNRYRGLRELTAQLRQECDIDHDNSNDWKSRAMQAEEKIQALNRQVAELTQERDRLKGKCDDFRLEKLKLAREISKFINE